MTLSNKALRQTQAASFPKLIASQGRASPKKIRDNEKSTKILGLEKTRNSFVQQLTTITDCREHVLYRRIEYHL
jgi:hypothetical protein